MSKFVFVLEHSKAIMGVFETRQLAEDCINEWEAKHDREIRLDCAIWMMELNQGVEGTWLA
mgnify:CR=1 FL=1|tara:strand:- start:624 stop:806 length:183 start_codon:yes stop_codon:yes gene_type:complete